MQHKSYLVPVTSPNTKLCGVQSLTFLPPAVHLTTMTFIFALVSKNSNGLGFLHSLIFHGSLKSLSSSHLLGCGMLQSGPERQPSPSLPWPEPTTVQKLLNALVQPWAVAQLLIFGPVPCWHGISFTPSQLQLAFAWEVKNTDGGHSWLSGLVHTVIDPRW